MDEQRSLPAGLLSRNAVADRLAVGAHYYCRSWSGQQEDRSSQHEVRLQQHDYSTSLATWKEHKSVCSIWSDQHRLPELMVCALRGWR